MAGMAYFQSATAEAKQGNNIFAMLTPVAIFFVLLEIGAKLIRKKEEFPFRELQQIREQYLEIKHLMC